MTIALLCVLLITLVLAAPLEASLSLTLGEQLSGQLRLSVWGMPCRWVFRTGAQGGKLRLLVRGGTHRQGEHPAAPPDDRAQTALGAVVRSNHARHLLRRGVQLEHGCLEVRLALGDAARTARLTGLAAVVRELLPGRIGLRVVPDFWSDHSTLGGEATLRTRAGVLAAAALLGWAAWMMEKRAHASPAPAAP